MVINFMLKLIQFICLLFCFSSFAMEDSNRGHDLSKALDEKVTYFLDRCSAPMEAHCTSHDTRLEFLSNRCQNITIVRVVSGLLLISSGIYLLSGYFDIPFSDGQISLICPTLFGMWNSTRKTLNKTALKSIYGIYQVHEEREFFGDLVRLCKWYHEFGNKDFEALNTKLKEEIVARKFVGMLLADIQQLDGGRLIERPLASVFLLLLDAIMSNTYEHIISEYNVLDVAGITETLEWLDKGKIKAEVMRLAR